MISARRIFRDYEIEFVLTETLYGLQNLLHPLIEFFENENLAKEIWNFLHFKNFNVNEIIPNFYMGGQNRENAIIHKICHPRFFGCFEIDFLEKLILNPKLDVNVQNNLGMTPLMFATEMRIVKLLLKRTDLNVNLTNQDGKTALILACQHYNGEEKVKALLERKDLEINYQNNYDENLSALFYACESKNLKIVKILLQTKDLNINLTKEFEESIALWSLCRWSSGFDENIKFDIIKEIISRNDFNFQNEVDCYGDSVLMKACIMGRIDIVKILLKKKNININLKREDGNSALLLSLEHSKIIKILLKRPDLDINAKNEDGSTFFIKICERRDQEFLKIVSKLKNVDLNAKNVREKTGFMYLMDNFYQNADVKTLKHLVKERKDLDINLKNKENGENILIFAWKNNDSDLIKILLKRKDLDVNVKDKETGDTLFMWACKHQHVDIVKILMKNKNVNFRLKNKNKQTAIQIMNHKKRCCDKIYEEVNAVRRKKRKLK